MLFPPASQATGRIPAGVWVLGFVSLLMDISSELIHSLMPVFMVTALGASMVTVGVIEGIAEATAMIVRVFSGTLSDYWGRRKPLAVLGYGLGALSKPLFALASTSGMVLAARFMDRIGKGIRGAPRDALVADITPEHLRGAAYGLRQSLDTVGGFLGPLLGIALMLLWANDIRAVFWVAVIPAVLAVLLLMVGVREPAGKLAAKRINPIQRANLQRLSVAYWWVVGIGALCTLARFSEAFLVLRVHQGGLDLAWTPLVLIAMSVVYALGAYPFGALSDRIGRRALFGWGMVALMAADALLAATNQGIAVWLGVALWGLHMAMTQGLLASMVADTAPEDMRGTAFGCFNLVSGIAMLFASVIAGVLWDQFGAPVTFQVGLAFAALTVLALALKK